MDNNKPGSFLYQALILLQLTLYPYGYGCQRLPYFGHIFAAAKGKSIFLALSFS